MVTTALREVIVRGYLVILKPVPLHPDPLGEEMKIFDI